MTIRRRRPYYAGNKLLARSIAQGSRPNSRKENIMGFIAWLVLGAIAGFIASRIVDKQGKGLLLNIVLGVVGAELGGLLFRLFGMSGVTGLNLYSLLVAVLGAVILLWIYHGLIRRRA
jgi:uncharacterized membrane protein YeaQ/YmgE (transglycosylase-associated protein family)